MMGYTHTAIGVATGLAVATITHQQVQQAIALAAVAGLAALLPDVDHPKSEIRQKLGGTGDVALFWLPHRGLTHTVLALALVSLGGLLFAPALFVMAAASGYASHLVGDLLTRQGLALLWPLYHGTVYLLPRPLRISTGSFVESVLYLLALGAAVTLFFSFFH